MDSSLLARHMAPDKQSVLAVMAAAPAAQRQVLLLQTAEQVKIAKAIFPNVDCFCANESLPPEVKGRKDVLIFGLYESWVDAMLAQAMVSGCQRVRWATGDITKLGDDPIKALRDLIGSNEYTSPDYKSSAPEAVSVAPSPSPIAVEAPSDAGHFAERDEDEAARRYVSHTQHALNVLCLDIDVSGTRSRQRRLISRIRESLDTLDFVIGYEAVEREQRAAA